MVPTTVERNARRSSVDARPFVFPAKKLKSLIKLSGGWSKVALADIPRYERYKDRWDLIRKFLKIPPVAGPSGS
jgi:hypothetical protein